jgi:HEAT repeat protein
MCRACCIALLTICLITGLTSLPRVVQAQAGQGETLEYTADQIKSTPAETFLARMATPEPGYQQFAAMHALGKKAKDSDPKARWTILNMVVTAMNDTTRGVNQRFQCCYVISDCGDEQWVPTLVHVLTSDPSETMRSVAAEALGSFLTSNAAKDALRQAAQVEKNPKVLEVINRLLNPAAAEYTPEQIKSISAETFLERMAKPEAGYQKFAAMHALGRKAKDSDANARRTILTMVVTAMNDKSRTEFQRFQCCYVISDCRDEQWVSPLIDVLLNDPSPVMRSVAAEALGAFPKNAAAKNALRQASQEEKSPQVLEVVNGLVSPGIMEYTPAQVKSISVETFLERMQKAEVGYAKFAALHALAKKAKDSDADTRRSILTTVVAAMNDRSRPENQRFQCCYVISDCGDAQWVPALVDVLVADPSSIMRAVAAEALAKFPSNAVAHDALVQASRRETSQYVLDVLNRVLGKTSTGS